MTEIGAGARAGKNAVENNYLFGSEWESRKAELDACGRNTKCFDEKNEKGENHD